MPRLLPSLLPLLPLCALLFAGCAARAPAPVGEGGPATQIEQRRAAKAAEGDAKLYTVKKGDTLQGIALDHGVDYRELAAWNNIENPNRIQVGRPLRVAPPGAGTASVVTTPEGSEIRPIAAQGGVEARPLDGGGAAPAPTLPANTESVKRSPSGGKLPYSAENLARLKAQGEAAPAPAALPPPAEKPAAPATAPAEEGDIEWAWPVQGRLLANFSDAGGGETNKGIDIAGKIGDPVHVAAPGKVIHVGNEIRGLGNFVVVKHNQKYLSVYANTSRVLVKQDQMVTRGQKIAELGNSDTDQPKLHFEVRHQGKPVDPLRHLPPR